MYLLANGVLGQLVNVLKVVMVAKELKQGQIRITTILDMNAMVQFRFKRTVMSMDALVCIIDSITINNSF